MSDLTRADALLALVQRLRSQQTRAAASRRLVFDLTDEQAAGEIEAMMERRVAEVANPRSRTDEDIDQICGIEPRPFLPLVEGDNIARITPLMRADCHLVRCVFPNCIGKSGICNDRAEAALTALAEVRATEHTKPDASDLTDDELGNLLDEIYDTNINGQPKILRRWLATVLTEVRQAEYAAGASEMRERCVSECLQEASFAHDALQIARRPGYDDWVADLKEISKQRARLELAKSLGTKIREIK